MATRWEAAAARLSKEVVVVAEFDTSDGAAIPRFSSKPITKPLATYTQLLLGIGSTSGTVNPTDCTAEIRGTTIQIMDKDAAFTRLLYLHEFRERVVTLYAGFGSMPESYYLPVFKGQVSRLQCTKPGVWTLTVDDLRRSLKSTIFTDATAAVPITYTDVNPIDFLIARLTTDDSSGLGISTGLVDVGGMEQIRDDYFSTLTFSFSIPEPQEAKEFLEREICLPLGLYFSTLPDGSLTLRKVQAPTAAEALSSAYIDEDDIIGDVQVSLDLRDLLNEVLWKYDWDSVDEEFDTTDYYLDSDSVTAFAQTRRLAIESQGMATAFVAYVESRNDQLFARFANPYPRYKLKTTMRLCRLQPGQLVAIKPKNTPDISSGGLVWNTYRFCEVLSVNNDYKTGTVGLELMGTPFELTRTGTISALSSEYADASAGERLLHCWIGRAADNQVYDGADYVDGYVILFS